jgi:hypothetical protein
MGQKLFSFAIVVTVLLGGVVYYEYLIWEEYRREHPFR